MARVSCGATSNSLHEVLRGIGGDPPSEAPTDRGGFVCESEEQRLAFTGKLVSLVYDRLPRRQRCHVHSRAHTAGEPARSSPAIVRVGSLFTTSTPRATSAISERHLSRQGRPPARAGGLVEPVSFAGL
jgi:hypothetical protein